MPQFAHLNPRSLAMSLRPVLLASLIWFGPQVALASEIVTVLLDSAKIVKLPEKTQTVIVGNPIIADVTLLRRNGVMVITGKGFGETNLIALDGNGTPVAESTIRVQSAGNLLMVQRGMDRESYNCTPRCEPTLTLGDTTKYIGEVSGQIQARNGLAQPTPGQPVVNSR